MRWRHRQCATGSPASAWSPAATRPIRRQAFVLGEIERWARVIKETGTTAH